MKTVKKPGLLGASVQLELQRLDVGHLEPKMPPVSQTHWATTPKGQSRPRFDEDISTVH